MRKIIGKSICLMAFLSLFTLTSCDKSSDEGILQHSENNNLFSQSKYITYKSTEEYLNRLNEITHMTQEERATYETQNGYISFGRYCDELYNKIDFDKFKSQEEIFSFVYENKDYLKLTDEGNGEYTLDVMYNDKLSRYMYGLDKIFIIADKAYKILDTKFIACSAKDVEELTRVTEENFLIYSENDKFVVYDSKPSLNTTKDAATNHGIYLRRTEEDGANQTRCYGIIELVPPTSSGLKECTSGAEVRPYHRVLGVWYYCSRTLDLNTKFYTHYLIGSTWYTTGEYTYSRYGVYASCLTTYTVLPVFVNDAHFGKIYVYGDSPDTDAAIINYY